MRGEDANAIVEMARELAAAVGDPTSKLAGSDLLRDGLGPEPWFDCIIAEVGSEVVGYVLLSRAYEAHTAKRRLWIGDLYVRPSARRIGVAQGLLRAVARRALELECDSVYWELWRLNSVGRTFFQAFGAEEVADLAIMRLDGACLAALSERG
jgi:predicted N-acetyltransferase YhbS